MILGKVLDKTKYNFPLIYCVVIFLENSVQEAMEKNNFFHIVGAEKNFLLPFYILWLV